MINTLNGLIDNTEVLVKSALAVAAAIYVAGIWWRTKALVPTLAAVALAAVVVWAANNITFLEGQVGEAIEEMSETPEAPALVGMLRLGTWRREPKAPPRGPRRPQPVRPARRGVR